MYAHSICTYIVNVHKDCLLQMKMLSQHGITLLSQIRVGRQQYKWRGRYLLTWPSSCPWGEILYSAGIIHVLQMFVHNLTNLASCYSTLYIVEVLLLPNKGIVKQVYYRFHQVDAVIREVGNLVRTYPTAFIEIPEALQVCTYILYSFLHTVYVLLNLNFYN